ncbi:preprotein translocase, SecA subunit [Alicyclobacillus hesperidum URH17-3-68]|uniref:ABC-three component system protein n=1 Tax=Alicyclobacillus hesperidum TaxID=89784 RepID=UPI000281AB09|nr:ABC-three component system protein [Alicyclobacillus hesperidum]EJY57135.1 preprotein translocase, SecA subunit [Alicyclobacillus hesperidum URH17-3-68]
MKRLTNDDTLTKLGDIYHYLVVLESCLDLNEGEVIYVEEHGDIAKASPFDPKNIEVKHHLGEHNLADRDTEFWNTLKNWVINREQLTVYKHLILLTTSAVTEGSAFFKWDKLAPSERYARLVEIGNLQKQKEKSFRRLYQAVFECPQDELMDIVGRVQLCTGNPGITTKLEAVEKHPVLKTVPTQNIPQFIEMLLGYIVKKPASPPYMWRITYDEFNDLLIRQRDRYSNGKVPIPFIPPEVRDKTSQSHKKYRFVKEIERIDYDQEINDAVLKYWQAMTVVSSYFRDNYLYKQELLAYQEDLRDQLRRRKRIQKREMTIQRADAILMSQGFYDEAMMLSPRPLGSFSDNQQYFQNGIIHSIVDDGKITWHLEDQDGN